MTSDDTDALTRELFRERNNFGLSDSQLFIAQQEKVRGKDQLHNVNFIEAHPFGLACLSPCCAVCSDVSGASIARCGGPDSQQ
eukprot:2039713-Amphidinium_carterae.1